MYTFPMRRERLKGNTDDDGDDEVVEQPAEKIKLEEVENKANDQVGQQVSLPTVLSRFCDRAIHRVK